MSLAFREAGEGPVALLLHGYPNSSFLWRDILPSVAAAGWRAIAPDFPGYGDTPLGDSTGTWEDHIEALDAFVDEHDLAPAALVVHDWGGLIGLRWACAHPEKVCALSISNTGFFPDGRWHGTAKAMREPGQLDDVLRDMTVDTAIAMVRQVEPRASEEALAEYAKGFATPERRLAHLALYRSGDFEKLADTGPAALAALAVPTLILWGGEDEYAPVGGAHRLHKAIPGSELIVLEGAGHFLMDDAPELTAKAIARFLGDVAIANH